MTTNIILSISGKIVLIYYLVMLCRSGETRTNSRKTIKRVLVCVFETWLFCVVLIHRTKNVLCCVMFFWSIEQNRFCCTNMQPFASVVLLSASVCLLSRSRHQVFETSFQNSFRTRKLWRPVYMVKYTTAFELVRYTTNLFGYSDTLPNFSRSWGGKNGNQAVYLLN